MRKLPKIKNIVIKIGSNILTDSGKVINEERIEDIAAVISKIKKDIPNITIVSSGAIAAGFKLLGFSKKPKAIIDKQACASTGQARLMWFYENAFREHGLHVGQILVTKNDFSIRKRYLNARSTIKRLHELNAIPIINENDVVVINEMKYVESFGDNDNLSALVSGLIDADLLLILSDVNGVYDKNPSSNPDAVLISEINKIDSKLLKSAGDSSSGVGTGGMYSKIIAAGKAIKSGCKVGIINGSKPANIISFLNGEDVGTYFNVESEITDKKKAWLSEATIPQGVIVVDNGAKDAIKNNHASLLAIGILKIDGSFKKGAVVNIADLDGNIIAIGQIRYSSEDLNKIKGKGSDDIYLILGERKSSIVIHCDDMGYI